MKTGLIHIMKVCSAATSDTADGPLKMGFLRFQMIPEYQSQIIF